MTPSLQLSVWRTHQMINMTVARTVLTA